MEKKNSHNIKYSSVNNVSRAIGIFNSPTVNRQIIIEKSQSTDGLLIKQYSCEQIFNKNINIKQIKFSTICSTVGEAQGQEPWNVNLSASTVTIKAIDKPEPLMSHDTCHTSPIINNLNRLTISNRNLELSNKSTESRLQSKIKLEPQIKITNKLAPQITEISTSTNKQNIEQVPEQLIPDNCSHLNFNPVKIKTKLRPLMHKKISQMAIVNNPLMKMIFFGLVGVLSIIIFNLSNEINENQFDFTNASLELQEKIYGQDNAINELINYYDKNRERFSVVVLVGGSGVGKSYASKIIKKYFPHEHNIFEYSPPLESVSEWAYNLLSPHQCNLIILEHLTLNYLLDFVNFVEFLSNKRQDSCTMILAMLNPEIVSENLIRTINLEESVKEINEAFLLENIPIKTVSFDSLTPNIIDMCIRNEAQKSETQLTEKQLLEIKKYLLSMNNGCKNAYAKVQLYAKT